MKKIFLTLGTTAVIATPLATVVSCGKSTIKIFEPSFDANAKELTVARTTYINKSEIISTTTETSIKSFLNDLHAVLFNSAYSTSEKIKLTKNEDETKNEIITISDITFDLGTTSTNVNAANLAEVKDLSWQAVENAYINGKTMNLTADQNMTWQLFSKAKTTIVGGIEDDSKIVEELNKLVIISTKTLAELNAETDDPATTEEEANTKFGIVKTQFDSLITALGGPTSDWKFVSINFDKSINRWWFTYEHSNINRKLYVLGEWSLSDFIITSTKTLAELNAAAGTPATTEADANTRFGIVKAQFDSLITVLGGPTSDWEFVNIDFDTANSKIKLTYKHSNQSINTEIDLITNFKLNDN